jgi:hypothetical protein
MLRAVETQMEKTDGYETGFIKTDFTARRVFNGRSWGNGACGFNCVACAPGCALF